jgi:hypothetical protein
MSLMKRPQTLPRTILVLTVWCLYLTQGAGLAMAQLTFEARLLTVDANEGIAAGDIDGDGVADLVAGRNWYRGGDWAPRPLRVVEDWNGYVQSNGDFLWDVNGDGRLDVIAGSFLPTQVYWYENPGVPALQLGLLWKKHLLVDTGNSSNEGQLLRDLDGDGVPEWIVNSWLKHVPLVVWRFEASGPNELPATQPAPVTMVPHELGATANGHGLGTGDLDGDGRLDVLAGQGWYQQPADEPWQVPWQFHADWDFHVSLPIVVADVDGDGRNDLVLGNGHDYGLFWWQNLGPDDQGKIRWDRHLIDNSYSQVHALAWSDLDGDGQPELVAGKRFRAHNGNDPGAGEPPCLYYYDWNENSGRFDRFPIEEGHVGCGLQIVVAELTGDGKTDIAVAGKSGTWLLRAK